MKLEKEENRLSLRKRKINDVIFSKRKINYKIQEEEEEDNENFINENDFKIPDDFKINIQKFIQDVNYIIYNISIFCIV